MKAELMRQFLAELRSGELPDTPTTRAVANEFERDLSARKRGAPPKPGLATSKRLEKIWRFVEQHVAGDSKQRGAKTRAIQAAAHRFRIDESLVKKYLRRFRPMAELHGRFSKHFKPVAERLKRATERLADADFEAYPPETSLAEIIRKNGANKSR
jgi:hypothetical protein